MRGPTGAIRKLAQAGRIPIGWSTAKIGAIARRPLQCYRCLEIGHVRRTCTSKEDRGYLCYRYGGSGHRAVGCTAANPNCLLCEARRNENEKRNHPRNRGYDWWNGSISTAGFPGPSAREQGDWRGGRHGGDDARGLRTCASTKATWDDREERKTCSFKLSGRTRST